MKLAVRQNRDCLKCKYNSQRRVHPYSRVCPGCGVVIEYKYSSGYSAAKKKNRKCNSCSKKGIRPKKTMVSDWDRHCTICQVLLYYSTKDARDRAMKKNQQCKECADTQHRMLMVRRSRDRGHYPQL